MAAFGVGTLPMLITMGSAAGLVSRLARGPRVRMAAAFVVVAFGAVQIEHVGMAWANADRSGAHACCAHAVQPVAGR
jgi:sulfite exporter TauE/SafE